MQDPAAAEQFHSEILELPGRNTLEIAVVRALSRRSDLRGALHYGGHLAAMTTTGLLIWLTFDNWWLLVPALVAHGFTIVTMFAPMHECVHKTAFKTPWLNDAFGWIAGALCLYNFTYYRRYHTWHHRYTQDAERDPELETPKPGSGLEYAVHISGLPFWWQKPIELATMAIGRKRYPFVPEQSRAVVAWSARAQVGLYLLLAALSIFFHTTVVWWYWLLPAILAQPLLRAILIVEHTGCTTDTNGLTNTRTTLASAPVRFLMWNMPFHAEHHLYPSITFFCLPQAHQELKASLAHIAPSYPRANGEVIRTLHETSAAH